MSLSHERRPRALVACEESQSVTIALRELGVEAYSCDIEPCSGGHPEWHLQQDVTPLLAEPWEMIIAFPPCTHLAVAGARVFEEKRRDGRQQQGVDFFMSIANAQCAKIAIENPVGIMSTVWRKPDQIIQPWMFGDPYSKRTCLWLKGLPLLVPTDIASKGVNVTAKSGNLMPEWYYKTSLLKREDRARARSKTFPGIALAMAQQWARVL